MPVRTILLLTAAAALLAEELRLDGGRLELDTDETRALVVGPRGATVVANAPARLVGPITLETAGEAGLDALIVARNLRGLHNDDWRLLQLPGGSRRDPRIDFPHAAMGTPEERARFGVAGSDADWDAVSIQWDGWIAIREDGTDLATRSDDGSRVWIDRDGDGACGPGEWGANGWGSGQGAVTRPVHRDLPTGLHRLRVQWEDGGGPNSMRLLWRQRDGEWTTVPDEGFRPAALLTVEGPATLVGGAAGAGIVRLGDGAVVASPLAVAGVEVTGRVRLAADADWSAASVRFAVGARLDLGGHRLRLAAVAGAGTVDLGGGTLGLPAGDLELTLAGAGAVATAGTTVVALLPEGVQLAGEGVVRDARRCLARLRPAAPLGTVIPVGAATGPIAVLATVDVPSDAPADLGIGAWRADRQGTWFQRVHPGTLAPGTHALRFDLGDGGRLAPEGHCGWWSAAMADGCPRLGLFLYATAPGAAPIALSVRTVAAPPAAATTARLADLALDGCDGTVARAVTGRRWELHVRPLPAPVNPWDPEQFRLDLEVTTPDGARRTFAGFHDQAMRRIDDGDRERFVPAGPPRFTVRLRPQQPGRHRLRLVATWAGRSPLAVDLPDLVAEGAPWDGIVRVDAQDPRFFSAGGSFVWPLGHNLHSIYDVRSRSALGTRLTPHRGSFARDAYLDRLAAAGGTGTETWLSAWNLGLEWTPRWPGYAGAGRYHAGHAWALDRFLDRCEARGVRVNLTIWNHGMARDGTAAEEEWPYHPWRTANGGWLEKPVELFTDERAFAAQRRLFRYLAGRYGDSPALLGWKLWAEVDLAHAPKPVVAEWHDRAAQALADSDPWRHPITTHWCGSWRHADPAICVLPAIGYLTIDAYHGEQTAIGDLLAQSVRDPADPDEGLWRHRKPVFVSEFGGSAFGTPIPRLEAEHAIGPWVGLVTGHAASPMLWWVEWIDQGDRYAPYRALSRFLVGEDLRGADAGGIAPGAFGRGRPLWCRAWSRPGRQLGYVLDRDWSLLGGEGLPIEDGELLVGLSVKPGPVTIEWWDADAGTVVHQDGADHPGGRLAFRIPPFRRHLAYKLVRR